MKNNLLARVARGVRIRNVVIGYLQAAIGCLQRLNGYR
jgi:choline-glycine betaine transporter